MRVLEEILPRLQCAWHRTMCVDHEMSILPDRAAHVRDNNGSMPHIGNVVDEMSAMIRWNLANDLAQVAQHPQPTSIGQVSPNVPHDRDR